MFQLIDILMLRAVKQNSYEITIPAKIVTKAGIRRSDEMAIFFDKDTNEILIKPIRDLGIQHLEIDKI